MQGRTFFGLLPRWHSTSTGHSELHPLEVRNLSLGVRIRVSINTCHCPGASHALHDLGSSVYTSPRPIRTRPSWFGRKVLGSTPTSTRFTTVWVGFLEARSQPSESPGGLGRVWAERAPFFVLRDRALGRITSHASVSCLGTRIQERNWATGVGSVDGKPEVCGWLSTWRVHTPAWRCVDARKGHRPCFAIPRRMHDTDARRKCCGSFGRTRRSS